VAAPRFPVQDSNVFLTIQAALQQGTEIFEKAVISVPRLTAEVLLCHALRCERSYLYAHSDERLSELQWIHYGRYLNERLKGKPTQYITHHQEFYGREFHVDQNVLIPRPETEHLVEAALQWLTGRSSATTVLDVGTGSGAIAISLALETRRTIFASDVSLLALAVAERNRRTYDASVQFLAADLLDATAPGLLDLLVSNPPYVPGADAANMQSEVRDWEPHVALFAGDCGLEIYRRLIDGAAKVLKPAGRLIVELGFQSLAPVREMLSAGWTDIAVSSDLAGWPRVLSATHLGWPLCNI
jgi:release factor glutamine methyltransferase